MQRIAIHFSRTIAFGLFHLCSTTDMFHILHLISDEGISMFANANVVAVDAWLLG